jgi:hypothetical protein
MASHDDEGVWDFDSTGVSPGKSVQPSGRAGDQAASSATRGPASGSWVPGRDDAHVVTGAGVHEPLGLLIAAAACTVPSIVIGLRASWHPMLSIVGWLLGGLVAVGLVTWFTLLDTKRRADPYYLARPAGSWLRGLVILAAIAGVALNAWQFADYVSRVQIS